jgi:hypothetical protein
LWELHYQRGQFRCAQELAEAALQIAEENSDQAQGILAHQGLGATLSRLGQTMPAHLHHMEAGKVKEDGQRHRYAYLYRYDPDVMLPVNHALTLWYLGYPDQGRGAKVPGWLHCTIGSKKDLTCRISLRRAVC